jgi:hypothetical protein
MLAKCKIAYENRKCKCTISDVINNSKDLNSIWKKWFFSILVNQLFFVAWVTSFGRKRFGRLTFGWHAIEINLSNDRNIALSIKQCVSQMSVVLMSIGQQSASQMFVSQMSIGQMFVSQMSIGQVFIGQMTRGQMSLGQIYLS